MRVPGALLCGWALLSLTSLRSLPPAPSAPGPQDAAGLTWFGTAEAAAAAAHQRRTVVMMDFSAEWCAACKEFEAVTFPAPEVSELLRGFSLARFDLTNQDETSDALQQRFNLIGLPSLLFLCPDGAEIPGTRVEGFLSPQEFKPHLEMVREKAAKSCAES